jgi:hypothetical protein
MYGLIDLIKITLIIICIIGVIKIYKYLVCAIGSTITTFRQQKEARRSLKEQRVPDPIQKDEIKQTNE